jgi:ligand-binding sensor domain-containing protein
MRVMVWARAKTGVGNVLLLLFALCLKAPLLAQHYPILPVQGAPKNINSLFQDSTGRVWVGTDSALYLFDGTRFYSMSVYGFPQEQVQAITEDSDGGIWVITDGGPYGGQTGKGGVYRYAHGHLEKELPHGGLQLVRLSRNGILATIQSPGDPRLEDIVIFRREQGKWTSRLLLEHAVFSSSTSADSGGIVFGCYGAWCELSRQQIEDWPTKGVQPIRHPIAGLVDYPSSVLRDKLGCVWARTGSTGWFGCRSDGVLTQLPAKLTPLTAWEHLQQDADGDVLSLGMGSVVFGRPEAYHRAGAMNGVPEELTAGLVAHDGTIWLANANGLYRFLYPFRLEYWSQNDGVEYPNAILGTKAGLLVGSAGILRLSPDHRRWDLLASTESLGTIRALGYGPNGTIYAAANGPGLSQLTTDGKILASSSNKDRVFTLSQDSEGRLWAGGKGMFLASRTGNLLTLQNQDLGKESVLAMRADQARKTLWSCNWQEVLEHKNDSWLHFGAKDGLDGLRTNYCTSIALHPDGDAWISYLSLPEISRIETDTSNHVTVKNYSTADEAGDAPNSFLDVDSRGWLWRGSDANYVATPASAEAGVWLRLDERDGIPMPGGNQNTFYGDSDGSVWWGSGNTVVHFSPEKDFAEKFSVPQIFVSGFSAGKDAHLVPAVAAQIPYGEQLIAHIGSLQFDRRSALRLRWRLLPEQTVWQTGRDLDLHLGKLHWGAHKLQVQAQMGVGPVASAWSDIAEQPFDVLLPVWLQWPAMCEYLAALCATYFGVRHWRKRRKEREETALPGLAEWRLEALSSELHQLTGQTLDERFVVGELLARGGFASVLHGSDMAHGGRPCAIKVFRQELHEKDWMARRFKQEVTALERIDHPNVVDIYGSGQLNSGAFYLVMEFVDGKTLRERFQAGKLDINLVVIYLRELGSALQAIHAQDICHRDLKPENVMLRNGAEPGSELVLIDFSIAIVKDPDETMFGLSRAAGTLNYMAPEQAIGYADTSTDIYSLAKILIEMLTGERLSTLLPDASMDLPERIRELLRGLDVGLSPASIERIAQALEFDPARRPKDAYAFAAGIADDLENCA